MRLLTKSLAREWDRRAEEVHHVPLSLLMENAGRAIADIVEDLYTSKKISNRLYQVSLPSLLQEEVDSRIIKKCKHLESVDTPKILFLLGTGNNGADGLVAMRHLLERGIEVETLVIGTPAKRAPLFIEQERRLEALGIFLRYLQEEESIEELSLFEEDMSMWEKIHACVDVKRLFSEADIVVDAVMGTGFYGTLPEEVVQVVSSPLRKETLVLAVDIPSGMDADTGRVSEGALRADITITFGGAKVGMVLYPGVEYVGNIYVAPLGAPCRAEGMFPIWLEDDAIKGWLPHRKRTSHKGDYGHVLCIGGSSSMQGAIAMSAMASVYMGSGKTSLMYMEEHQTFSMHEVMRPSMPDIEDAQAWGRILRQMDVVAMGPGMGRTLMTEKLVKRVLSSYDGPVLLDADALYMLGEDTSAYAHREIPAIVTPHVGEFLHMTGLSMKEVEARRVDVARDFAQAHGVTLVLKGYPTVIATKEGQVYINSTGNPYMATGGMGDVLVGMIASLVAQNIMTEEAAALGAYVHGKAADRLYDRDDAVVATAVIKEAGSVIYRMKKEM